MDIENWKPFRFYLKNIDHENTKGPQYDLSDLRGRRKHEIKQVLFRVFKISCFRDNFFSFQQQIGISAH